jgi:hypothetical protein
MMCSTMASTIPAAAASSRRASGATAARLAGRTAPSPSNTRSVVAKVGRSQTNELTGEPEWVEMSDAAAAIAEGQELYEAKEYPAAIAKWEGALKLGGSGTKRDRSKPAELSLGEKQAIFYNLMCAHSTVENVDKGLEALEAALWSGYCSAELYGFGKAAEDYDRLMRDADLAKIREDARFTKIIGQYKVEPTELQLQLDPSQSVIGRAMKMWGKK